MHASWKSLRQAASPTGGVGEHPRGRGCWSSPDRPAARYRTIIPDLLGNCIGFCMKIVKNIYIVVFMAAWVDRVDGGGPVAPAGGSQLSGPRARRWPAGIAPRP